MIDLEEENKKIPYRKTNDELVGNVVLRMLRAYGIEDKYYAARAKQIWHETMGTVVSGHTQQVYVKHRKLYISISSSSLRQEMAFSKEKIRGMINQRIGLEFIKEVIVW